MRIVGGRLKGRRIRTLGGRDTRPTTERVREAIFGILEHAAWAEAGGAVEGATVLDAFAGSGALGLEALSRGAETAIFIERSAAAERCLRDNIRALSLEDRALVLRRDALRPGTPPELATLLFLDPPYGLDLPAKALAPLAASGWLAAGAVVVIEQASRDPLPESGACVVLDERRYGDTRIAFLRVVRGDGPIR